MQINILKTKSIEKINNLIYKIKTQINNLKI